MKVPIHSWGVGVVIHQPAYRSVNMMVFFSFCYKELKEMMMFIHPVLFCDVDTGVTSDLSKVVLKYGIWECDC